MWPGRRWVRFKKNDCTGAATSVETYQEQKPARLAFIKTKFIATVAFVIVAILFNATKAQQTKDSVNKKWGEATNGISVSITASETSNKAFSVGEPIAPTVFVKYNGNGENDFVVYVVNRIFTAYDVKVLRPDGKPAPLTPIGKRDFDNAGTISLLDTRPLKPGDETSFDVPLSECFDLSLPGKYKISVTMRITQVYHSKAIGVKATSNEIELTVAESQK